MLISDAWLREVVATKLTSDEIATRLTMGGLEVAAVQAVAPKLSNKKIIIGEIVAREPHPKSSRLGVCKVNVGTGNLQIVCAADNAVALAKVVVALVGAKLPAGKIKKREVQSIDSAGMLCSAQDLGLAEHSGGIMVLDATAPVGESLLEYLNLDDCVFDLELTPNRGDCLSLLGVAREAAVLCDAKLRSPSQRKIRATIKTKLPIKLKSPQLCPRYVGRVVRNINMQARTPDWIAERLRRCGQRSRNVVVDITNYVMLELGQPMHAFDYAKLNGGIIVRRANKNERLKLLDGSCVVLNGQCVIADHQKAVALAGVMGGYDSAIGDGTRDVFFESAFFPAAPMLGVARNLGMHTEASHRYERGVDANLPAMAIERATQLLIKFGGGQAGPISEASVSKQLPKRAQITLPKAEIKRILGVDIPAKRVSKYLRGLGMKTTATARGWKVVAPSWRFDIEGVHDLVEEVGRVDGFDKIAPRALTAGIARAGGADTSSIKNKLTARGYNEAITYSFIDPKIQNMLSARGGKKLRNPIADNMAVMRLSLWGGLLEAVRTNLNRQRERVRLFEVGRIYDARESDKLAAVASGAVVMRQWGETSRAVDFFDMKGDVVELLNTSSAQYSFHKCEHPALHPGRAGEIRSAQKIIGHIGQLHPRHQKELNIEQPVYLFELDLEFLHSTALPKFEDVSRHPAVRRDLAVVVDKNLSAQQILDTARAAAGNLLTDIQLFDVYNLDAGGADNGGGRSFAFGLTFQDKKTNLTNSQIEYIMKDITDALKYKLNARLRNSK